MKKRFIRSALPLALVFTLLSCSSEEAVENTAMAPSPQLENYAYNTDELAFEEVINEYRVSIGLNPLQAVEYVSYKAEEHNDYMIANNVVNHDFFEERSQDIIAVIGAVKVNENVAYNYVSASSAFNAWLESPSHKANIEGNFTHFGISVRQNPQTGKKYYTNIFIKK